MSKIKSSFLGLIFLGIVFNFSCKNFTKIDYSSQVKPILNRKCIACHGGVKQQGGFSLLFEEEAKSKTKSGKYAIVPGHAEDSEMIRRLTLHDPEERMPYKADPLSKDEINILTKWIDQGAEWGQHWAYKSVEKPEIPDVDSDWKRNNIDAYVFEKQEDMGLKPSEMAEPTTLARRASLDIIGFNQFSKTKSNFVKNPSEKNYETLVDSLLKSPHYGEKWTSVWLDLARYADTKGYERDGGRQIWRYRDWLINAFNSDMPYSQFLTEQLAGDLLPNSTDNQLIATAFHRNTMTNDEGGTDNEEFRTAAVLDRVNTTWETLMGTTFACVQCHSHPYDPFKHEDYYRFASFFNNTRDEDTYADYPVLRHLNDTLSSKLNELNNWLGQNAKPEKKAEIIKFIKTFQPSYNSLTMDQFVNSELSDTKWLAMRNNSSARLKKVNLTSKNQLIFRYNSGIVGGILTLKTDSIKGKEIAKFIIKEKANGWINNSIPILETVGIHNIYFVYENPKLTDVKQNGITFDWFYFTDSFPGENQKGYADSKTLFWDLVNAKTASTPILLENPNDFARENNVFVRGNWLVKGKKVNAGVPKIFENFDKKNPTNRLEMAQWMCSPKHPLTARTIVNRLWEQLFGNGLVETLEDIGSQGAAPKNQKLLDYLSYQLVNEYNWSLKKLLKEIMLSATYRQSSVLTPDAAKNDLANEYFTRGPRVRLSAEQIRDQALAITGTFNPKMYGPPVMPWQPKGIWASPYDGEKWTNSADNEQYRRAVYTYWKRTSAYPSMLSFDGVGREVCSSRRIRTNTPLQALVTLNDSAYVDISRKFAEKIVSNTQKSPEKIIAEMYFKATEKTISKNKLAILVDLYQKTSKQMKSKPIEMEKICKGFNIKDKLLFSSMTIVANAILNLDEVLTKS
jgi:Protein of unknown function (DUF1553)/Protein of unknown function (DUF1549)/Planctomycete cytochrome C